VIGDEAFMRYTTVILLLAWVLLAGTARAGHVPPKWSLDVGLFSGPAWDIALGKQKSHAHSPPECALTGICDRNVQLQQRCAYRPECIAFPPFSFGHGAVPRGFAFGIDKHHAAASGNAADVSIPPSALLLLGCALFVPLLSTRRFRRRRH